MRKEKYIKVKTYKGNTYFTVQFFYGREPDRHSYSKTFNSADYDSPTQALNEACKHRDIKRAELLTTGLPTRKMTVLDAFEKSKKIYKRAESTEHNYDLLFNAYFNEYRDVPVAEIDEWTITTHLESLRNERSDVVLANILSLWKRICKTAKGLKALTSNPADSVEAPDSTVYVEPYKQYFTDEEIDRVIDYLLHPKYNNAAFIYNCYVIATMIKVIRYSGLRPREIKYLKREDVNFEENIIYIKPHGKNVKNRPSMRGIPMNSAVKAELMALFTMSPYDLPFALYGGIIPTPSSLSVKVKRAGDAAGVEGFHLYGMRHVFDSDLVTNMIDPRTVMELMGHSNVQTTLATYARSTEAKRKEAIERVENSRKPS